ncbi:MAG: cystathionine beta-lyase [Hyphomicrobiaceae bacterium]
MAGKSPPAPRRQSTEIVHRGRAPFEQHGFVNTPVYRGSTVLFPDLETLETGNQRYTYGRKGSPSMTALEEALVHLEQGQACYLMPSGLAAVTTALLAFVKAGDHILIADTVYQPTRRFATEVLSTLGVEVEFYDPMLGAGLAAKLKPNTQLIYAESPGSQTFEVQDLPAISAVAKSRDLFLLIDNTWATPLFLKPLTLGADLVIHAATKYIVGHADANLGAVICNERAHAKLRRMAWALGTAAGSEEVYLGTRGLRTLEVRLERHQRSAILMAEWLAGRPEIARVLHPSLPSCPGHAHWKRDFKGSSGLFSVLLKPHAKAGLADMLNGLELYGMGYSWGGFESLVVPFDPAHGRTASTPLAEGTGLRFHIGLEDVDDLKEDLAAGLARLAKAG